MVQIELEKRQIEKNATAEFIYSLAKSNVVNVATGMALKSGILTASTAERYGNATINIVTRKNAQLLTLMKKS